MLTVTKFENFESDDQITKSELAPLDLGYHLINFADFALAVLEQRYVMLTGGRDFLSGELEI